VLQGAGCGAPREFCLAGGGVGGDQTRVGDAPNTGYAIAGADEQRGGGQGYERQKQRVLDQILSLFVLQKSASFGEFMGNWQAQR